MDKLPYQFGRYLLQRKLGEGGMGAVYLAHDSVMNAEVAIKLPHFESAGSQTALERFYREARVMFGLRHSGICPVYDVGEIDGQHYLVMACIRGTTLSHYLKQRPPLTCLQAVKLIRKVALAVQAAHEQGILHRDLKPANIMLEKNGEPVVMDFGLAHANEAADVRLTQTGTIMGTPVYMPLEQANGSLDLQGPHTDVYSLGVVLYELLTGRVPFVGEKVMDILAQIARDEPIPPMEQNPQVDQQLNAICLKAMAKQPSNRYASMRSFADALGKYTTAARERSTVQGSVSHPNPAVAQVSSAVSNSADGATYATISTEALSPEKKAAGPAEERHTFGSGELETQPSVRVSTRPRARGRGPVKPVWLWSGGAAALVLLTFVFWKMGQTPSEQTVAKEEEAGIANGQSENGSTTTVIPPVQPPSIAGPAALPFDFASRARSATEAQASQTAWAKHLGRQVVENYSLGMDLVVLPPGEFLMGSPESESNADSDEKPQHRVRLTQPLLVGKTEVTQGEWTAIMGTTPWKLYVKEGASYAATYVSHGLKADGTVEPDSATEFCRKLGAKEGKTYRLLTEAEWEYACRAGTTTRYHFGDTQTSLGTYAWFEDNAYKIDEKYAHEVAKKQPNPFGLHDMHGNVYEWCQDWYDSKYYAGFGGSTASDPAGAASGSIRVYRGGSWSITAGFCRSAYRFRDTPGFRGNYLGFRVAQVPSSR